MKSLLAIFALSLSTAWTREKPLNILLITADDLGYEAMDFLGGSLAKVTPNLSLLAKESLSFQRAHVNIAICAPSRAIIATGRYGHNSGCYGFNKLPKDIPTVFTTFQKNGYLAACVFYQTFFKADPKTLTITAGLPAPEAKLIRQLSSNSSKK